MNDLIESKIKIEDLVYEVRGVEVMLDSEILWNLESIAQTIDDNHNFWYDLYRLVLKKLSKPWVVFFIKGSELWKNIRVLMNY